MIKKEINRLCVHHNDVDGRLAAVIIKNKYPNTELIEVGYNDYKEKLKDLFNKTPSYEEIYLVDFSLKKDEMEQIISNYNIIWCDHHKSAKEELYEIWNNREIKGIRSLNKCGAMLVWDYLYGEHVGYFEELRLVDDYDRWIFQYGEKTHHFIELSKEWNIEQLTKCIKKTGTGIMNKYISEGKNLFKLKLERINRTIEKGIPITFKGKKALIVNNTETMDGALLGNTICKQGYDIAIKFEFNKDKVIFGLNSIGELDVSDIAKEYNGGGHKNASGFVLSYKEFQKFIEKNLKKKFK